MPGDLHPDNQFYVIFARTMRIIEGAHEADAGLGDKVLPAIWAAQNAGDEQALSQAWEEWFGLVPSAFHIRKNRRLYRDEIEQLERSIGIVAAKNIPPEHPRYNEFIEKIERACGRLIDLHTEGFVPMPNDDYKWIGEGYVF